MNKTALAFSLGCLTLTACPKNAPPPAAPADPVEATSTGGDLEPPIEPPAPAAQVPEDGPPLSVSFALEQGQRAQVQQTLVEQTSFAGRPMGRVTVETSLGFEVRREGDWLHLARTPREIDVVLDGPSEEMEPFKEAIRAAWEVQPTVVAGPDGGVQDVLLDEQELERARATIQGIADGVAEELRAGIEEISRSMTDPTTLARAVEEGVTPWHLGQRTLEVGTPVTEGSATLTFLGWVACDPDAGDSEDARCGAVLKDVAASEAALAEVRDTLSSQMADWPGETAPVVTEAYIDERYVFVLHPDSGRVSRFAHDKRTTVFLDMEGQTVPWVKNLSNAEFWSWETTGE